MKRSQCEKWKLFAPLEKFSRQSQGWKIPFIPFGGLFWNSGPAWFADVCASQMKKIFKQASQIVWKKNLSGFKKSGYFSGRKWETQVPAAILEYSMEILLKPH